MTKTVNLKPFDKTRRAILKEMLLIAAFDGWTATSLRKAVKKAGLPRGTEKANFPGGALGAIQFWTEECNRKVDAHFKKADLSEMKIRDKVTQGVWAYIQALDTHEDAARRAMARLTIPDAIGQGPKQVWSTADTIWRAIGDTSTDFNFYSKRTILSGVISSTLMKWMSDSDPDKEATRDFLDARIANVMSIEKAKWQFKKRTENIPSPAEVLGRIRYGSRRRRRRG